MKPISISRFVLYLCLGVFLLSSCATPSSTPPVDSLPNTPASNKGTVVPTNPPASTPTSTSEPYPPVVGPTPSYRVGIFYYPWYGNPQFNQEWRHWTQNDHTPPEDVGSDYYPVLGAYSSTDPQVVAQHMAWLRQANIGIIIITWWGRDSFEDQALPLLLDIADRYEIKIAFHIEPYQGRNADGLVEDIQYLYDQYGDHPAFFRTTDTSRWSPDDRPKGLFFLFAPAVADSGCAGGGRECPVEYTYWRKPMDAIHALNDSGIVIGQARDGYLADDAHFDGMYDYIAIQQGDELDFSWGLELSEGTWYVPAVAPGNSARRVGYPEDTYLPRLDGNTYIEQWNGALALGVEPWMVAITSFNEWHEGSQIEPAAENRSDGRGNEHASFEPLTSDGYLNLTRQLSESFLNTDWTSIYNVRFEMSTTSDWTSLRLISGGKWGVHSIRSINEDAEFQFDYPEFLLTQSFDRDSSGKQVEVVLDILLAGFNLEEPIVLDIGRGNIGSTRVVIYRLEGEKEVVIGDFVWSGLASDPTNARTVEISPADLISSQP